MIIVRQNKIWIRIISLAIVCLFIAYDLNWANPDLFTPSGNQDALSPALFTSIQSDKALIETAIQFYIRSIGFDGLGNEELRLYPTVNGQRVDLFVEERQPEAFGWLTILGVCRGKKLSAKINIEDGSIEWTEKSDQSQLPPKPATDMAEGKKDAEIIKWEDILTTKGLKRDAYQQAAVTLSSIAKINPGLSQQAIQALEGILTKKGLNSVAYQEAADTLSDIAINNPQLSQQAIQALEGILTKEGLESVAYWLATRALSSIAMDKPNLIQPSTVLALEGILTKEGPDSDAYWAAGALTSIAINRPDLFAKVYSIIQRLKESGKAEQGELLKNQITENLPKSVKVSHIAHIKDEDWAVILAEVDESVEHTILKEEGIKLLFAPSRDEKTHLAIQIKHRLYREARNREGATLSEYTIKKDILPHYIGAYKLPWKLFREFMDKNYDAFHRDPTKFTNTDIGQTDLSAIELPPPAPGATDMTAQKSEGDSDIQKIKESEDILNTPGLESDAYWQAARALSNIAINSPQLSQQVIQAFEGILIKEGLESYAYPLTAAALSNVAKNNPNLIQPSTVQVLEGVLTKEGLGWDTYWQAANALSDIAKNNPNLIQPSTVQALEGILTKKGLESYAYQQVAVALSDITEKKPNLIQPSTVQVLEGVLTKEGLGNDAYHSAAWALSIIAINNPQLSQHAIQALEGILNKEGLDWNTYWQAVNALSFIAKNRPDLFTRIYSIVQRLIESGKVELVKLFKERITENLPDPVKVSHISHIKAEDWAVILAEVDESVEHTILKEEAIKLLFAPSRDEKTHLAIQIKHRLYREAKNREGATLSEYAIKKDILPHYIGAYKLPWKLFREFMDKNYDAFHHDPTKFTNIDIGETDLSTLPPLPPAPKGTDMAGKSKKEPDDDVSKGEDTNSFILKHIDIGIAIEVNAEREAVIIIDRDKTRRRDTPLEDKYRQDGTFKKIMAAKDSTLLKSILDKDLKTSNFRNLDDKERDKLIEIVKGISVSLIVGHGIIGETEAEYKIAHVRTGYSRQLHGLEPTVWIGEYLCEDISAKDLARMLLEECQHVLKPPAWIGERYINLDGKMSEAANPKEVIGHDEDFRGRMKEMAILAEKRAASEAGRARFADEVKLMSDKIRRSTVSSEEVTAFIGRLVDAGQAGSAEDIATAAISTPPKKLILQEIGKWVDLLQRISTLAADRISGQQKQLLIRVLKDDSKIQDLFFRVTARFTGILYGVTFVDYRGECTALIEGKPTKNLSSKHASFLRSYFVDLMGRKSALTEHEEDLIRSLSLEISRTVAEQRKGKILKNTGELSFREGMRFKKIFSRYYLNDLETAKSMIFKYFTLVAWSVYGRFIRPEEREKFADIIVSVFNRKAYEDIFQEASISSDVEITPKEAMKIFDLGRYDSADTKEILPNEQKILAAVERARACVMPAFIFTPAEYFPDAVMSALSREKNSDVFTIAMNGFTQRKEFFGMHLPDAADPKAEPRILAGAIARIIEYAKANPARQVYFVMENPDFVSGDIRMALHQFLLERKITIEDETDESGRRKGEIALPDNLQVVLTMERDSSVGDESFMDRVSGCFLDDVSNDELKEYLCRTAGVPKGVATFLTDEIYGKSKKSRELRDKVMIQDIAQIGYYVAGRIRDNNISIPLNEVARQEAALHLESKFSSLQDEPALNELSKIAGNAPDAAVEISPDGKSIVFNGIRVDIDSSSSFGAYIARKLKSDKKVPSFGEALIEFLPKDYFLTGIEERIFCLLARVYKYAPSKVVFLQGLPGGGKTTIARVFLDVIGCRQQEYTLNKEADLSLFRGSLGLTPEGLKMRIADYWKELPTDRSGVIINEADMRLNLIQWLWPDISGRPGRFGWEFASSDKNNPMGKVVFGKDRMLILTGNARKDMPPIIGAAMPATYCMERSEDDIYRITEKMFLSGWSKMPESARKRFSREKIQDKAKILSAVYNAVTKGVRDSIFTSKREVTPRQIERFKDLLFKAVSEGADFENAFSALLYVVFVAMWDNPDDMRAANGIIRTHVADSSPPLSGEELLDFCSRFSLSIPLLILTDDTISFDEICRRLLASGSGTEEEFILLSRFHTKKSLIGGISRGPEDKEAVNKLGILPWLILKNHLSDQEMFCWMPGYLNLNPQVAPVLNEFFQTNWLDVKEVLDDDVVRSVVAQATEKSVYERLAREFSAATKKDLPPKPELLDSAMKREFVRFLIGYKSGNFLIRALGSTGDPIALHPADVDRFFTVNVSESYSPQWIRRHAEAALTAIRDAKKRAFILKCIEEAFRLYKEEKDENIYPHNRLSRADIDIFLQEVMERNVKNPVTQEEITLLAYHVLGMGLTRQEENPDEGVHETDYRLSYAKAIGLEPGMVRYNRDFVKENGHVYFVITAELSGKKFELGRSITRYENAQKIDEYGRYAFLKNGSAVKERLQAPLANLLAQQASAVIFMSHGMGVALEGDPGGGKTSGTRDICKATGRPYHEEGMYKWISLGTLLGSLGIRGEEIVLNTLDKDKNGRFMLPFLRIYSEGGTFVADEGMVSKGAGYLLRWMAEASRQDEIDLGTYHPGLQGIKVKRHPEFSFAITQNDHFKTKGRKPLPFELDRRCGKVRVDNILSREDAKLLIDYYLEGYPLDFKLGEDMARLHMLLVKKHPERRMVSPRDLIDTVLMIPRGAEAPAQENMRKALFEAVSVSYLEGMFDAKERSEAEALIKEIFPDFKSPDYGEVALSDRGFSNIDDKEIAHLLRAPSLIQKARVMEKMLASGSHERRSDMLPTRQVLILEEPGASGIDFLKMFSKLTGRRLETVEGHPFVTAKILLTGESFEFEPEFDEYGHRKIRDDRHFRQTHGALRRHLIKEDKLSSVPANERTPLLMAITNVESIPKNELVKLNELIATREIILRDDDGKLTRFILPGWVTIVPVTSNMDKLTSPFANRFRKLGLPLLSDSAEVHEMLSAQFPNITPEETKFLMKAASAAFTYCDDQIFEMSYDFTKADINELALRVQMYKQADSQGGIVHSDPLWYSMKAIIYVFLQAMCPQDRAVFVKGALEPLLSEHLTGLKDDQIKAYTNALIQEIRAEDRTINKRSYEHRVPAARITGSVFRFPNGMKARKEGDTVTVITDSQAYQFSWEGLAEKQESKELSKWLSARREGDTLILTEKLLAEIGISPLAGSAENLKRSLPLEEMGSDEFMHPADTLIDALNSLLQAQTPVRTATGKLILPRVVLMAGETGSGKTTIPKMLSKAEGTPLVRINPWRQMQGSKITVSLSIGKTVEMNISDFLLACGKINGKRITAAYPTSNRVRILVDEANVTRDAWYILDAIARGEKKFSVETPGGDAIELELDAEIDIILTYNPPERYGGTGIGSNRYKFPQPFSRKAIKLYISEPLEEYSDEEMHAIMKEIYRRGEAHYERMKALKGLGPQEAAGDQGETGFFQVDEEIFAVKKVADNAVLPIGQLIADINKRFPSKERALDKKKPTPEEIKEVLEKESAKFRFDPTLLLEKMEEYSAKAMGMSIQERYAIFANSIFIEAMKGLALEKIDKKLLDKFIAIAGSLDPELNSIIGGFSDICREEKISVKKVNSLIARFRRISSRHHVYFEGLQATVTGVGVFINYLALPVIRTVNFDPKRLRDILGEDDFHAVFGDHVPEIIVADRPNDGMLGYYDGIDMVCANLDDQEKELEIASHELGHYVSDKLGALGSNEFSREIAERLRKNLELYSHLFPLMLVGDPKKYIHEPLLEKINNRLGDDDAYALASAHVLDAFSIEYAMPRIGNKFEINRIKNVLKKIDGLSDGEIAELAVKFWKAPRQYFPEVERGVYYERQVVIKGGKGGAGRTLALSKGPAFKPRTKVVERMEIEAPEGGQEEEGKGKEIADDEDKTVAKPGETVPLPPASRVWMKKYQELFAADDNGDDLEVRYVSEGGTDVNPEAWLTRNADELLIAPEYEDEEKTLAQNVMFVIDVSGSIQDAADVQEALETMIRTYSSFLLELSRKNSDLNISLATISDRMDVLFDFNDWKKARSHAAKRALLEEKLGGMWQTGSKSGIDTPALLEKMSEIEFPSPGNKDSKNLVVVFTDGQETGSSRGAGLKALVKQFSEGKYIRPDGKAQAGAGKGKHIDIAFVGALLQDNGAFLVENYPCFLNVGEESADSYVEALFKMAYMQAKNMPLDGDLSETIKSLGQKLTGSQASARAGRYGALTKQSASGERSSSGWGGRMFSIEPVSIITGLTSVVPALLWLKGLIIAYYPVLAPLAAIIGIGVVSTIVIRYMIHFNKIRRLVKGEDWAVILNEIDESVEHTISKGETIKLLFAPSRDEKTHLAIQIKHRLYKEARNREGTILNEYTIKKDILPHYIGAYKLPWKLFREFMDKNYDAFHRDPAKFTNTDIGEIGLSTIVLPSAPGRADMAEEKKEAEIIQWEGMLTTDGPDRHNHQLAAYMLSEIALLNNPKLSQQAILALEGILIKEGLDSITYHASANALSHIAKNRPDFFARIYSIIQRLIKSGKVEQGELLKEQIKETLPKSVKVSHIAHIKGEDWAVILAEVDESVEHTILKEEAIKLLFAPSRDEKTHLAIQIKHRLYKEARNREGTILNEYTIKKDILPHYIGAYKLPWKLFREFMDKNYDAFHQDPTKFTNTDIGQTDLSTIELPPPAPGATDMTAQKSEGDSDIQKIKESEATLNTPGLDSAAYQQAANALSDIAINNPQLSQQAILALEGILNKEGLESYAYWQAAYTLSNIAINNPQLNQQAIQVLEGILTKEGLRSYVYQLAVITLSDIAKNRPDLFAKVYSIIQRLKESGKVKQAEMLKEGITKNLPDPVKVSHISHIKGEDWAVILMEIDESVEHTILKEEAIKLLFAPSRDEKTHLAIQIKHRLYKEARNREGATLSEYTIKKDILPHYIGAYKLPWKLFREFMDKNYDAFHQDPTKFTNTDIGQTDLSTIVLPPPAPGATDMAEEKKDARIIQLEGILTTKGLEDFAYKHPALALSNIAINNPQLSQQAILALEGILIREGLESNAYWAAAYAVSQIAENSPNLIQPSTVQALEGVLTKEGPEIDYSQAVGALSQIAENNPNLIQPSTVQALEGVLIREGLDGYTYSSAAITLSFIAINRPDLFAKVYSIIQRLKESGKAEQVEMLKKWIKVNLPRPVKVSHISHIKGEDWAVILMEIDESVEHTILKEEAIKLLFAPSRDEKTHLAIQIKHRLYREARNREGATLSGYTIKKDILPHYIGAYKLPWKLFREFMDKNYDAFHQDPTKFTNTDIGKTDLSTLPPLPPAPKATDMTEEKKDAQIIQLEGILTTKGLGSTAYWKAAYTLFNIARNNPELSQQAIQALENTLAKEGLEDNAYWAYWHAIEALSGIARNNPELILPSTVLSLEGILTKEGLDSGAYGEAAGALFYIAEKKPELIQPSTVLSLEGILTKEGLNSDTYYNAALALYNITIHRPDLFAKVYSIIQRLIESGRAEQGELLKKQITENLPKLVNVSHIAHIKGEDWAVILMEVDESVERTILKEEAIKLLFAPSRDEKTHLAIQIKHRLYKEARNREGATLIEYTIKKDILPHYIGAYKLPWKLFREFMDKNYDAFHQDPTKFTNIDIGETDLSTLPPLPPTPKGTDMSMNLAAGVLRDISEARLLAKCIKEATISRAFDKKLVLAFDENMARYQSQNPLRRVMEALNELKKKKTYRKILSNLIIVPGSADNLPEKLKEYIGDKNSRVFVFAGADDPTRGKLRKLEAEVRTVYIDEKRFQSRAYYPIAEIVVLALAQHLDGIIGEGDTATMLKIEGKDFELASINIESMRMDGQAMIFKLLASAKEHDTQELMKRYAAMTPFLEAA